jgi:hypothetical protein
MKMITALGDRLLAVLVPRATAAAGCPTEHWYEKQCMDEWIYGRWCTQGGNCRVSCGGWEWLATRC